MLTVTLREKDGGERQQTFDQEEITLGRADGCDIVLPKNNVSKRHARLVDKQDRVVLVDLRSTNGTYVNGRRITAPEMIGPRDKVYIGDFVLTVESAGHDDLESAVYSETIDAADILGSGDEPQVVIMNEGLSESQVEDGDVGPTEAVGGEAAALQAAVAHVVEEGRDEESSDPSEQWLQGRAAVDTEALPPMSEA
ncbi:MAG: FHA domain-containing protein, partial [Myxococcota bacterium]|nr:FHA domain-containing protein [Myxococcota bacterium]